MNKKPVSALPSEASSRLASNTNGQKPRSSEPSMSPLETFTCRFRVQFSYLYC